MITHLVITLSQAAQDARDLYGERRLGCARCGRMGRQVPAWALPGLCTDCAIYVESVTVAAPRPAPAEQSSIFGDIAPYPRYPG